MRHFPRDYWWRVANLPCVALSDLIAFCRVAEKLLRDFEVVNDISGQAVAIKHI